MRKIRMLLVAAAATAALAPVAAQASHPDCAEETCPPSDHCSLPASCPVQECRISVPVEIGHDVIFINDSPILECDFV